MNRLKKLTLGEMRSSGARRVLVYCSDHRCSHSVNIDADRWTDDVRLSDVEPLFTCTARRKRGERMSGWITPTVKLEL